MKHYKVMAAVAAGGSVPLLYAAGISITTGDVGGWVLAAIGTALALLAATYEARSGL